VKNWKLKRTPALKDGAYGERAGQEKRLEAKRGAETKLRSRSSIRLYSGRKYLEMEVRPLSEIAKKEGLTSCRVTKITNLLKLASE
jgi:hypothetical protein